MIVVVIMRVHVMMVAHGRFSSSHGLVLLLMLLLLHVVQQIVGTYGREAVVHVLEKRYI